MKGDGMILPLLLACKAIEEVTEGLEFGETNNSVNSSEDSGGVSEEGVLEEGMKPGDLVVAENVRQIDPESSDGYYLRDKVSENGADNYVYANGEYFLLDNLDQTSGVRCLHGVPIQPVDAVVNGFFGYDGYSPGVYYCVEQGYLASLSEERNDFLKLNSVYGMHWNFANKAQFGMRHIEGDPQQGYAQYVIGYEAIIEGKDYGDPAASALEHGVRITSSSIPDDPNVGLEFILVEEQIDQESGANSFEGGKITVENSGVLTPLDSSTGFYLKEKSE